MHLHRNPPWRRAVSFALVGCLAIATACGGGDDVDDAGQGSAAGDGGAATAGAISTPPAAYDEEATLRFGIALGPTQGLDPHRTSLSQDTAWLGPIYDPLIIELPDASLVPGLATAWQFVNDNTALELTLREGITFHDGAPFDADAVKANIDRAKGLDGSAVAPLLEVVESVEVVDQLTVRLHVNGPAATLPRILSDRPGMMISPAALDDPELATRPVGAGMYRIVEYRPGDRAVMERFEEYWNPEWNRLRSLEIVQINESSTRLNGLRSGELDLAVLDPNEYASADGAALPTEAFETTSVTVLHPNRTRGHLDDLRVRQALMHAIDRQAIVDAVMLGYANPSPQWYGESFADFHFPELGERYPYDPERARALIEEAGLTGEVSFEVLVGNQPVTEQIAQILQAQFAEVGVEMTTRTADLTDVATSFYSRKTGDALIGTAPGRTDPAMNMQLFFTDTAHSNPGAHTIPEVTELYERSLEPAPDEERLVVLQDLVRETVEQAGMIIIFQPQTLVAAREGVGGFHWALRGQPDFRGTGVAA